MCKSSLRNEFLAAAAVTLMISTSAAAASPAATAAGPASASVIGDTPEMRAFYERRAGRLAWSPAQAQALRRALADAPRHGLSPDAFLSRIAPGGDPATVDASLTRVALDYARALAQGSVDPESVESIFTLGRNRVDLAAGLDGALASNSLEPWLASLAPHTPEYQALSAAYLDYRAKAAEPRPAAVTGAGLIEPGDTDARLPAVVELLAWKGAAPTPAAVKPGAPAPDPTYYSPRIEAAVRAFQRANNLTVDGIVGPSTLAALNRGPRDELMKIAVNMERRRWLDRNPAPDRIDVNLAAARLDYFRDGKAAWSTRTVVGAPDKQTPELGESFDQIVVNPPWNVPTSIAQSEILPKGSSYLASHDMYIDNGRVVQRPGPNAALGQVKFDMQNRYAIYLHDTPSKSLFGADERHRSHGCVRVQDAVDFARRLADERGKGAEFEQALASGQTTVLPLGQSVAVRLLYQTAYLDQGQIRFTDDPYGRDAELARAMGLGGETVTSAFLPLPAGG